MLQDRKKYPLSTNQAKIKIFFSVFFLLIIGYWLLAANVKALSPECSSSAPPSGESVSVWVDKCTSEIKNEVAQLQPAQERNQQQLADLKKQIISIQGQIKNLNSRLDALAQDIKNREQDLAVQQELLQERVRSYYIRSREYSPILVFLSSSTATQMTRELILRGQAARDDERVITDFSNQIVQLATDKDSLEKNRASLQATQTQLNSKADFLGKEVAKVGAYLSSLSAKQQSLIAAKLASLNIPLFAYNTQGGCSSDIDPYKDPGFSGIKFGLFTYGVPNRVGLNQYGAWGRAKAGQSSDTILHAYYNFDEYKSMDATIKVNDGNGYDSGNIIWTGSLEDYVKRIYEVPDSWTDNNLAALKAQAIAARSYALAETDNGNKSICANTHCQVFQKGEKGGNWSSAVSQTSGQVMVQGGKPITAYFSSTHGGYMYNTGDIGWSSTPFTKRGQDTNSSVNGFSDLNNNAYDKDSPWFYCDWGRRSQYNNTAWLKSEEMADIVNSILLVQSDNSADSHILQTDKSGADVWNEDRVKQELSKYRTPFSNISSAHVDVDFNSGQTTKVYFSGDAGSVDFPTDVFKKYFNLRAPSSIQIVGPLYNIEHR